MRPWARRPRSRTVTVRVSRSLVRVEVADSKIKACCTRGSPRIVHFAPRAHSTAALSGPDCPGTRTDIRYDRYNSRDTQPGPQTLSRPAAVQTSIRPRTHAKQSWSGVRPRGGEPGLREAAGMHPARMPYRTCTPARPGRSTTHARRRRSPRAALRKLAGTCSRPPVGAGSSRLDRRTRHTVASASVKWLEQPLRHTRERVLAKLRA